MQASKALRFDPFEFCNADRFVTFFDGADHGQHAAKAALHVKSKARSGTLNHDRLEAIRKQGCI
jgi:hypothetical protein